MLLDEIKEKAKYMDDISLEQMIKTNKEDFREGVYEIYIDEYKARGKTYNENEIEKFQQSKENIEVRYYNWIQAGYVFSFLGGLLGIIIAFYIKPKKNEENTESVKYRRLHFRRLLIISLVMTLIVWPFMKLLIGIIL